MNTSTVAYEPRPHQGKSDERLLDDYDLCIEHIEKWEEVKLGLEAEMHQRMRERGATAIPSEHYVCEIKTPPVYDQAAFAPLKEVFGEMDLETCYTEAHQALVEFQEQWNTVKVLALARRYGAQAQSVVEHAKSEGRPSFKFARRKRENGVPIRSHHLGSHSSDELSDLSAG